MAADGICNHDIYYVEPDGFGPRTLRIDCLWRMILLYRAQYEDII